MQDYYMKVMPDLHWASLAVKVIPELEVPSIPQRHCSHISSFLEDEAYLTTLHKHKSNLSKYSEMVKQTLDLNQLNHHSYVIKPDFDPWLKEFAEELCKKYTELGTNKSGIYFITKTLKRLFEDFKDISDKYTQNQSGLVKEVINIASHLSQSFTHVSVNAPELYVELMVFEMENIGQQYSFVLITDYAINNFWIHAMPSVDTVGLQPLENPRALHPLEVGGVNYVLHLVKSIGALGFAGLLGWIIHSFMSPYTWQSSNLAETCTCCSGLKPLQTLTGTFMVNGAQFTATTMPVLLQILRTSGLAVNFMEEMERQFIDHPNMIFTEDFPAYIP
ncbi:hypothetical protein IW262DRAFT_1302138 [Armillaria fumosa]|nr:hypothetical protein IW262DRAFT_1302138 [Armillaria fumosa]